MSQLDLYHRHTGRLLGPLHRMSVGGVRYDERAAALLHTRLTATRLDCEHQLTALTGRQLYAKEGLSNLKLKDYLYGDLGLPKQMRRRGKSEATVTVDELAIRQLMVRFPKRDDLQAAGALILKHREVATAARFVNDGLCDPDGRMRFGYSFNTEAFRLSSSSNPMGTGLNGQNIPHQKAHRACYLPEPGHLWLKVDLSQAESRSCYMYSGDAQLIALARTRPHEFDAHRHNAAIIFEKPHEQITKQERNVGKMAVHGCVDGQTEVLTKRGFIRIDRLTAWDTVAEWDGDSRAIRFVTPEIVSYPYDGPMLRFRAGRFSQFLTPNHRMPYVSNRALKVCTADALPKGSQLPLNGLYAEGTETLTEAEARLLVALQADGTVGDLVVWHFRKARKVKRLQALLAEAGMPFSETIKDRDHYIRVSLPHAKNLLYWLDQKKFSERLLRLDGKTLDTILDELPHWDGSITSTRRSYFSTEQQNIEWVQILATLRGRCAFVSPMARDGSYGSKPCWRVSFNAYQYATVERPHHETWKGTVWCLRVPSSFFVIRRNGCVSITGNSQRLMTGKTLADRLLLMLGIVRTPDECQAYLDRYLDAHSGLHTFFRTVRQTLIRDRALTNTWGRTWRVPYERFSDELYRRACSFLMQSEIAEITNQWGVIAVDAYLRSQKMQSRLLVQVHDELGISVHPDEIIDVMAFVRASLEQPRTYPAGDLVIPAEFALGRSWAVEVEWKQFPDDDTIMAAVRSLT